MFEEFMPNNDAQMMKVQSAAQQQEQQFAREQLAVQASAEHYGEQDPNKSDLIRWQQELDDELETLKFRLMNYKRQGDKWVPRIITVNGDQEIAPPLLTEEGIQCVEAEVQPFLSKNLINSNLDERRILNLLKFTSKTLTRNLGYNYDTFIVEPTPQNMSHIKRIIKNVIIPTPFRAINGWTKKQDNMVSKRVETFTENPNQQNKGFNVGGFFGK